MAVDKNQIMMWAKAKLFGDWAPEDQEWGMQEFLKDKGWSVDDLATAIENNRFQEHADYWFKTKGHAKTKARNADRDQSGGYLPGDPRYTTAEGREQAKADTQRTEAEGRTAKINADIDAFYQELAKPLDPNDPEVMRVAQMAGKSAAKSAYGLGLEGGGAVENTQATAGQAAANTFAAERARRQQLQAQVGGLRSQTGLSQQDYLDRQRAFRTTQQQYKDGLSYENEMAKYQQGLGASQAGWGVVGGVLGGLGAGLVSGGNPMAIGAGVTGGSSLGAGLAGSFYGPAPTRKYTGGW